MEFGNIADSGAVHLHFGYVIHNLVAEKGESVNYSVDDLIDDIKSSAL